MRPPKNRARTEESARPVLVAVTHSSGFDGVATRGFEAEQKTIMTPKTR